MDINQRLSLSDGFNRTGLKAVVAPRVGDAIAVSLPHSGGLEPRPRHHGGRASEVQTSVDRPSGL
jgi:hypothetical protein